MAKAPRQMKETYPVGTKVIFSFWWYGRTHKHDGHICEVVKQWVKVAGKPKPRNYYKYRLRCVHPGCNGAEFNTEDCSATCQGISPANKAQVFEAKRLTRIHPEGHPPPEVFWGNFEETRDA